MTIALVENEEEVELLQKRMNRAKILWIALEPFCIPKLEEDGLQYRIIEDLFDKKELFERVSLVSEKKIEALSKLTNRWIKKNYPHVAKANLSILEYSYYYLTILFDGIFSRIFILNKILSSIKPKKVFICKRKCPESKSLEFPWDPDESIWAYCAEILQDSMRCEWNIVEYGEETALMAKEKDLKKIIRTSMPYLYNILERVKGEGLREGLRFRNGKKIVALDSGYQWKFTESLFKEKGYRIFFLHKDINSYQQTECDHDHIGEIGMENLLNYQGTNVLPLVRDKLNKIIGLSMKYFVKDYEKAIKIFKRIKPKAVLFSVITTPDRWVVLKAARSLNIPIFCWGHGASGQAEYTKQKTNELLICDFYFTQGEGSQETYSGYKDFHFVPIPAGFSTLDRLSEMMRDVHLKPNYDFIYVTTNYYQNKFHLSFFPGLFDNELFMIQRRIIDFLQKLNMTSLLKIVPTSHFKPFLYRQFRSRNIVVEDKGSFSDLLPHAKAIIIDTPTTVLLESLTTEKPVFVLTKFIKLTPQADEFLRRRAVCCSNEEDLVEAIRDYINMGKYDADVDNEDYLKAFGTYKNDGKSAERIVQYVVNHITH